MSGGDTTTTGSAVIQQVPLHGLHWPTIDPFLFIAYHLDEYPRGNGQFGPAAPLDGRQLGNDFAERPDDDGHVWRMYHGNPVPGFPQHPHRGFETVTYVRQGVCDHSDSLGAQARFGDGDTQWLTAGAGIVHSEMFPLLDEEHPNPLELFQIWLNLPSFNKMASPHFSMLWADDTPKVSLDGVDGPGSGGTVTVIAGAFDGVVPAAPPPDSWASQQNSDVAIWHADIRPGGQWRVPAAQGGADTVRVLYFFDGEQVTVDDVTVTQRTAFVVRANAEVVVTAGVDSSAQVLVLQGRPIGEPVAQQGPFVMNDRAGIEQAFRDYQRTGFGGWPWPADGPVHGVGRTHFARQAAAPA
jgi:quercetin 2,3-dioxygenase